MKAAKLFQTYKFKEALKIYEEAIEQLGDDNSPTCLSLYSCKAGTEVALLQFDNADKSLKKVLEVDPYHFPSLYRKAQLQKKVVFY